MKTAIRRKGGVGKTFSSSQLAETFENSGLFVIIPDKEPDIDSASSFIYFLAKKSVTVSTTPGLLKTIKVIRPVKSFPSIQAPPEMQGTHKKYTLNLKNAVADFLYSVPAVYKS